MTVQELIDRIEQIEQLADDNIRASNALAGCGDVVGDVRRANERIKFILLKYFGVENAKSN